MIDDFFDRYASCTAAGSGSQNWFSPDDPRRAQTGRIYYKLSRDVAECALLYSNLIDSTFADGGHSHANFVPGPWVIHALRAGVVDAADMLIAAEPAAFVPVTFGGQAERTVDPGEITHTDPFGVTGRRGQYLCVEMTFSGARIPCHTESLLPAFVRTGEGWAHSTDLPFPSMVAARRTGATRLGFIGDSITQGIGTEPNSYAHLAALIQDKLGARAEVWNLGLGYGRARDAALDGGWLYKARQNDVIVVCFGVNDLLHGPAGAPGLEDDLARIVRALKDSGVRVILQTIPPFDYAPDVRPAWHRVNDYIRAELSCEADALFDSVPVLRLSPDEPHRACYGGHPDAAGNAAWAEAIWPVIEGMM